MSTTKAGARIVAQGVLGAIEVKQRIIARSAVDRREPPTPLPRIARTQCRTIATKNSDNITGSRK